MDVQEITQEAFAALGTGRQVQPFTARRPDLRLEEAYRVAAAVRAKREARGERPVGRKIGFTNRTIWAEYNVHAPMWGYVYDRTVRDLPKGGGDVALRGLAEPRIEPEIVFGLAAPPIPGMDERALIGCIDWVAHGFEIVQSIFPHWTFLAADTIAAYGLHGALRIGPRHSVASRSDDWARTLHASRSTSIEMESLPTTAARPMCWTVRSTRCGIWSTCSPPTRSIRRLRPEKLSRRERSRALFRSLRERYGRRN